MSLTITDKEVDFNSNNTPVGLGGLEYVTATADTKPLYVYVSGAWLLDQLGYRQVVPDYVTGAWTLVLPWPTESNPSGVKWTITRANGIKYQGTVPNSVSGPLTILDLVTDHAWTVVS